MNATDRYLIDIEDLRRRMDDPRLTVADARAGAAALIRRAVYLLQTRPTYWVKSHIVDAGRHFYSNTKANRGGPTKWWLDASLATLLCAFADWYDEDYCPREVAVDRMSFEELSACVDEVLA